MGGRGRRRSPFARGTRALRRMGRVAWPSSCSRNAHDKNVLVRRAQSRINQATLENEMGNWDTARSGRPPFISLSAQLARILHEYASGLHGSECPSRLASARFRDEPS